jgi:branched-chain amino acid transport system substrate-binding protein
MEQAHQQGFQGQVISCTMDFYQRLVERTSKEFMEGVIFQFPDFDDPALNSPNVNFPRPNDFYAEYVKRYGADEWSAVSWEYASIMDLWADAAVKAGSVEPGDVLVAMKEGGVGKHAFGDSRWWGTELFGIDNALVGDWPVVVIRDGKATIAGFKSIPDWWDKHSELMIKHMTDLGQMWNQRT